MDVTDNTTSNPRRRAADYAPRTLTDADLDAIEDRVCLRCPRGVSQDDVYRMKAFLKLWEESKSAVGKTVLAVFLWSAMGILAVIAYFTHPWRQ